MEINGGVFNLNRVGLGGILHTLATQIEAGALDPKAASPDESDFCEGYVEGYKEGYKDALNEFADHSENTADQIYNTLLDGLEAQLGIA